MDRATAKFVTPSEAHPVDEFLFRLAQAQVDFPRALGEISAFHQGGRDPGLRDTPVHVGSQVAPRGTDVPELLGHAMEELSRRWKAAASLVDCVEVAAFAAFAVIAIHPFPQKNLLIARDFAHLVLMRILEATEPIFSAPSFGEAVLESIVLGKLPWARTNRFEWTTQKVAWSIRCAGRDDTILGRIWLALAERLKTQLPRTRSRR